MCFYLGKGKQSYGCWLVFFSIFGFVWPYSMYVESKVSRFDVNYMKVLAL